MLNVCHLVGRFIISVTVLCMGVFKAGLLLVVSTLRVAPNNYTCVFLLMFVNAVVTKLINSSPTYNNELTAKIQFVLN